MNNLKINAHDDERDAITPTVLRVNPQTVRFNTADLAPSRVEGGRLQSGDGNYGRDLAPTPDDEIVATARSATGAAIGYRRELQDTDLVRVNGMDISVRVARTMGLLDTQNRPVPRGIETISEEPSFNDEDTLPTAGVETFAPRFEAHLGELIAGTSATDQIAIINEVIEVGQPSLTTLERAASQLGLDVDALGGEVETVVAAFQHQADTAITRMGVADPHALYEWAKSEAPKQLQEAMRTHAMDRTTAGYAPLVEQYHAALDTIDPQSVLSAQVADEGIEVFERSGQILVRIDGHEVPWKVAIRQGLIEVSAR